MTESSSKVPDPDISVGSGFEIVQKSDLDLNGSATQPPPISIIPLSVGRNL